MKRISGLNAIIAIILGACAAPGDIEVHNARVGPTARGENAVIYLTLHNHSTEGDELIGASSNMSNIVELYASKTENNAFQLNKIPSLPLGPEQEITFGAGGPQIMLTNVKQDLIPGGHISLILRFAIQDDIIVKVQIGDAIPEEDHNDG